MTTSNQLLTDENKSSDFTEESDDARSNINTDTTIKSPNTEVVRLVTGILLGATVGGIVSILSSKNAIARINRNVQKVGNLVDKTATNISNTFKDLGEGIQSVAVTIGNTGQDVGVTVKDTAADVSETVKTTVSAVKNTAESVNSTVKTTADVINVVKQPIEKKESDQVTRNGGNETLYKLVPIE
jgi:gas vesicle protein